MGLLQVPEDVHRQADERGQAAGHVLWNSHHCLERSSEGSGQAHSSTHWLGEYTAESVFHATEEATAAGAPFCRNPSGNTLSLIAK